MFDKISTNLGKRKVSFSNGEDDNYTCLDTRAKRPCHENHKNDSLLSIVSTAPKSRHALSPGHTNY